MTVLFSNSFSLIGQIIAASDVLRSLSPTVRVATAVSVFTLAETRLQMPFCHDLVLLLL